MVQGVSIAFEKLTPREREILRLVAAHLQSKEIARALGLSPKTVEMHVLSARRRLSGMSRRDAALAFVAWEGGDPGNDYRKQPDGLAALPGLPPSERDNGNGDDPRKDDRLDPARSAAAPGRVLFSRQGWRYELSPLQWLGLLLGTTALIAVLLAAIAIGVHEYILAVQGIVRP
jgi:DNA-binding CsgD family transcriptional regulator